MACVQKQINHNITKINERNNIAKLAAERIVSEFIPDNSYDTVRRLKGSIVLNYGRAIDIVRGGGHAVPGGATYQYTWQVNPDGTMEAVFYHLLRGSPLVFEMHLPPYCKCS